MSRKKDTESADQPGTAGTAAGEGARDPAEGSGKGSVEESGKESGRESGRESGQESSKDSGKASGEGSGKGAAAGKTSGGGRQRRSRGKAAASRSGESRSEKTQAAGRDGSGASKGARAKRDETADEASGASGSRAGKAQGETQGETRGDTQEDTKRKDAGADESAAGTTATEGTATEGTATERTATERTATGETAGPARPAPRESDAEAAGEHRATLEATPGATPEANKGLDATRADELAYHDATMEELGPEAVDERGHRSVWATLFFILLGAIVVASVTLWGAPKVAPYLPATVAQQLVPGEVATAERLAALEDRLAQRADETAAALAEMGQRLDALASEVDSAAADETRAAIAELRETAEGAAEDAQALAGRVDTVQSELAAAREELAAVSDTLTGGGEGTAPPELAAALAALRTRVDKLAEAVEGGPPTGQLAERVEALSGRIDELEGGMAEAREARSEVSGAIRQARLESALETLASRLATGQPYAAPLAESAELSEAEAPEALAAGADSGLATAAELEASFPRHAQEAIAADIRARSGEGTVGQAVGWLRAQVAGRPVSEQEGDNAAAITSRIAARLEEGQLAEALAETEALSGPAREGLGGWLAQLRARVEAERALGAWRDQITAGG